MKIFLLLTIYLIFNCSLASEQLLFCSPSQNCACPEKTMELKANYYLDQEDFPGTLIRCHDFSGSFQNPLILSPVCLGNSPAACDPCVDTSTPGGKYYSQVLKNFPKGCGYAWKKFNTPAFKETVKEFLKSGKVLCSKRHQSMCTSATFLAFLMKAKELVKERKLTLEQVEQWADLKGPVWTILNAQARPDLLLQEMNLGEGRTLRQKEIPTDNWPGQGDLVQIWRKDRSGHSVVFSNLLKSPDGKVVGLCYWASNKSTNGYGEKCEPIEKVDRLIAARFK